MLATQSPFVQYFDTDGSPLDGGYVYFGVANQNPETSPVAVYWDAAGTQPAAQPIRTVNGYTVRSGSPATIYTAGNYSLTTRNARGALVVSVPNSAAAGNDQALQDQIDAIANPSSPTEGAELVGFSHDNAYSGGVGLALQAFVNVKNAPYNAKGDGSADDTAAIQAAINAHRGKIYLPAGTYKISSTIVLKSETILIGEGAGAYFQGTGYPRLTVLQPTPSFSGTDVLRADPADESPSLSYSYGVALRDLLIDCINIKNDSKNIIKLNSLSNSETFDSLRIINNNVPIAIRIGVSANVSALESDGLSFNNIYCLQCDSGGTSTNPVLLIESANEVSFRDSKFQRGTDPATVGSKAVHINGTAGRSVNAITFDSCSFTGAESGLMVQSENSDGQGPRWIRAQNCTFEGPKFPIFAVGESLRPVQFCTFGPGNRMISLAPGGAGVVLSANASNNTVIADEFTTVLFDSLSSGNTLYGGNSLTDSGTDNARISRASNAIQLSNLFREATVAPTLATGWTNASPANRTSAGYWKDAQGVVHLQGYVGYSSGGSSLIFTLPAGYVPTRAQVVTVMTNTGVGSVLINQVGSGSDGQVTQVSGGTGWVSLDGISFALY